MAGKTYTNTNLIIRYGGRLRVGGKGWWWWTGRSQDEEGSVGNMNEAKMYA